MNIVVNLNKALDVTSQDAVTAVKRRFKVRKAGHAGTLDPLATGVLLVCLNEATKITGFLADLDKEYVMTMKLGESTDTYDAEGVVVSRVDDLPVTREAVERAAHAFVGAIEQMPPMYSAVKVAGTPLYKLARAGVEVERKARKVTISSIELLTFALPYVTVRVSCSKGTYLRSLCNDIGNALGTGAYVTELRRTRIGGFTIETAAAVEELPEKSSALFSIDRALGHLPEQQLSGNDLKRAQNGNPVCLAQESGRVEERLRSSFIRLKDAEGALFGIGKIRNNSIKIERLFKL
ncbi:MAG: tRNA pseudouridine(55) synthase TruB [Nitrospirota bacterium]